MPPHDTRIACIDCDLLVSVSGLAHGERASCPRCGFLLTAHREDALPRAFSFALASAIFLVMANTYPFLSLEAKGLESVMTLPKAAVEIWRGGYGEMAALVLGVIVVIPGVMLGLLMAMIAALRRGRAGGWLVTAGRVFFWLTPWSMAEVFVIGVIVSLVKIAHMAHVVLGVSFVAYIGFTLCFVAALASLDRVEVWDAIERCTT